VAPLTGSTISGNTVEANDLVDGVLGGGVFVRGVTSITSSTIDGNRANNKGGGLFKATFSVFGEPPPPQDTRLDITSSTVYGNVAGISGGGIYSLRPTTIASSTIAQNAIFGGSGAGLLFADPTLPLTIRSSIFARNVVDDGSPPPRSDIATAVQSPLTVAGTRNLIMSASPNITLPVDTIADDPLLYFLAWNGGPTRTIALGVGSPALDAGNDDGLASDQRGANFPRVSGSGADIGAFETQQPLSDTIFEDGFDGAIVPTPTEHAYDDGDGDTNQGPPSTFDPDMLWGNYYTAAPGGEVITHVSIAFGPTFPSLANGPVTFWLLEDDDGDGDPRNAYAIASVTDAPIVFNDNFSTVNFLPTWVHGGFFVGASAKLDGGADRPARVDTNASGHDSWFFYAPDIAATINNLAAAPFGTRNDNPAYVVLPGAFMVRAGGTAVP